MGATGATAPRINASTSTATHMDTRRLFMTKNTEKVKNSSSSPSPYGRVMIRSCRIPYTKREPTTPTTHPMILNTADVGATASLALMVESVARLPRSPADLVKGPSCCSEEGGVSTTRLWTAMLVVDSKRSLKASRECF